MTTKNLLIAIVLTFTTSVTAHAGWEAVQGDALKQLVSNTTWEGKGFVVYWNADGTRQTVSEGGGGLTESWEIIENGTVLCAGKGSSRGERCGVIETKEHKKKEKTKYRSTRTKPKTGKRFHFKVKDGVAQ